MKAVKAGRKVGSRVKLNSFGCRVYTQFVGKTGKIVGKEVQTVGHGLAYGQRARYALGYWVRWDGEARRHLLPPSVLTKA